MAIEGDYFGPARSTFEISSSVAATSGHAYLEVKVQGTGGGDPHVRFTIPGGTSWYAGVDNSASDVFIVGTGTAVGTNGILFVNSTGIGVGAAPSNQIHGTGSSVTWKISEGGGSGAGTFTIESSGGATTHVQGYGPSAASTLFGVNLAGSSAVWSTPQANAMLVGTVGAFALVFGTNNTESFRVDTDSVPKLAAASQQANGAQTVTVGNLGPGGAGIAIREWFKIKNSSGTVGYIPIFA